MEVLEFKRRRAEASNPNPKDNFFLFANFVPNNTFLLKAHFIQVDDDIFIFHAL